MAGAQLLWVFFPMLLLMGADLYAVGAIFIFIVFVVLLLKGY